MKNARQTEILRLIKETEIETQGELAEKLREAGFNVTQATVSRDIKSLRLSKSASASGKVRYVASDNEPKKEVKKYVRVLESSFVSAVPASNLVVIKTDAGCAMAAAAAIEEWSNPLIIGSIAGDDTIFCATASEQDAAAVISELNSLLS